VIKGKIIGVCVQLIAISSKAEAAMFPGIEESFSPIGIFLFSILLGVPYFIFFVPEIRIILGKPEKAIVDYIKIIALNTPLLLIAYLWIEV